jgi:diguanylate cyclase (GGDEF)-like protein
LLEHSRAGDEVYRWAGDECLVVLPTAGAAQAVGIMDRLRAAVAAADFTDLQVPGPVTVSIGVATAPPAEAPAEEGSAPGGEEGGIAWRPLFDAADLHLFSAKRGGRNRVLGHGPLAPGADGGTSPEPPDAA